MVGSGLLFKIGWFPVLAGFLSLTLYSFSVSAPVNTLCAQKTLQGTLSAQGVQYVFIMLAGMLLGMVAGPWLEQKTYTIWRLLMEGRQIKDFRYSQVRICATILTLSSVVNLLFLLWWFNQFVETHAHLKTDVMFLVYSMGFITGGAWFMLLHRQTWWGLMLSSAMSMMVVSSVLSGHSWVYINQ